LSTGLSRKQILMLPGATPRTRSSPFPLGSVTPGVRHPRAASVLPIR